jgi:hypothetical protein
MQMQNWNKILGAAAAVLLVLSALTYWGEVSRADRFERGQKLLQSFDADEVFTIELATDGQNLSLQRQADGFVVREAGGYRARNEAINRLMRNLLDVELTKRVGAGDDLAEQLGLEVTPEVDAADSGTEATEVALLNASGEDMVRLIFAPAEEAENASYVRRMSGDDRGIYLTAARVFLDTTAKEYLDRELVEHPVSEIVRLSGPDFTLERNDDGDLVLADQPQRALDSGAVSRLSSLINRLRFDEVFVADDPEVAGLEFDRQLRFELEDRSGYILEAAVRGDEHFLKIAATFAVDRLEITREESDEELKEKSEILRRSDEVGQFNTYHGSWIYRLESFDGEKLGMALTDLTENS